MSFIKIESYADAEEMYQEQLRTEVKAALFYNDGVDYSRYIALQLGNTL
ncbi:hypothetical protein ID1001_08510 [Helicobacter pylori]|nr:hypothetical protein [Helicobacter pylori]